MRTIEELENLLANRRYLHKGSQGMLGVIADILMEILRELKREKDTPK